MGKNLIQQARGRGGPTYRSPGHRFKGKVKHVNSGSETLSGTIINLLKCPGHSGPLAQVKYDNGDTALLIAPEGLKVGTTVSAGSDAAEGLGNILPLSKIPEGTLIYNIEGTPGDGGKFVRASGVFAKILLKNEKKTVVMLPSKKQKDFNSECRACIGVVAGGGRPEKPFFKAGNKFKAMKAKNKLYPSVSGNAQNAVDHPFGNKRSARKSKARPAPHNAPPGRKVGMIRPSRTGQKKGKQR